MAPALSSLPPELHLALFQSLDNFADVSALMRTGQQFHTIWMLHTTSICSAILPRAVDCLAVAQELLEGQERFADWQNKSPHEVAISRATMLLYNQQMAYQACRNMKASYEPIAQQYQRILPFVAANPANEIRFIRCLYRFWAVFHVGFMTPEPGPVTIIVRSYEALLREPGVSLHARTLMLWILDQRRRTSKPDSDLKVWQLVDMVFAEMGRFAAKERELQDSSPGPRRGRSTKWLMDNIFYDLLMATPESPYKG